MTDDCVSNQYLLFVQFPGLVIKTIVVTQNRVIKRNLYACGVLKKIFCKLFAEDFSSGRIYVGVGGMVAISWLVKCDKNLFLSPAREPLSSLLFTNIKCL